MIAAIDQSRQAYFNTLTGQTLSPASTQDVTDTHNQDQVSISETAKSLAAQVSSSNSQTYDFTRMPPAEMKTVSNQLFKEGKMNLDELLKVQSMGVPLGNAGPNGEFIPLTEEERAGYENSPVNYLSTTRSAIQFLEQTGYARDPKSSYQQLKGILSTLTRLQQS